MIALRASDLCIVSHDHDHPLIFSPVPNTYSIHSGGTITFSDTPLNMGAILECGILAKPVPTQVNSKIISG